jgi:integrase
MSEWSSQRVKRVLKEDGIVADYLSGLESPYSQDQYLSCFAKFLDFVFPQMKGNLEKQAATFLEKSRRSKGEWAEQHITAFIKTLKKTQITAGTLYGYYKVIKGFCDLHRRSFVNIEWKRVKRLLGKVKRNASDRAPSLEEIKRLLEHSDRRTKALVLVTLSSGIRVGAWPYLRWKHVTPLDKDGQVVKDSYVEKGKVVAAGLTVYADDPEQYTTLITPEAYMALKEYMDYRKENGEYIGPESWLMRDKWAFKYGHGADDPKKLSIHGVKKILNRALWERGLRKPLTNGSRRHEFKASHGMRKFFKTAAEWGGMNAINVETLMNHSIGISDNYARPQQPDLFKGYIPHVDDLTIYKEPNLSQKQQTLEAQIRSSQSVIQDLQKELTQSKQQMVEMRGQVQLKDQTMRSLEDDVRSMREDIKNMFEVLWTAKLNDGRVGKDRTILDENRHITFYEDYADGQTRSVSVPIDSVKVDSTFPAHKDTTKIIRQISKDAAKQARKKNP